MPQGLEILLIGHAGHPEVVGTLGQLPDGAVRLIETVAQARTFVPRDPNKLAFVTQTTLSVDDTAEIVAVLKARFPDIVRADERRHLLRHDQPPGRRQGDRADDRRPVRRGQPAELELAAPRRGRETRRLRQRACLIERAADIRWGDVAGAANVGVTAGASAPEVARRGGDRRLPRALRCHARDGDDRARAHHLQRAARASSFAPFPDARRRKG